MLVGISHEKVGAAVAEYLIGKGYRKLALLSGDDERARMRRDGFASVAAARGLAVQVLFVPAPSTMALGRQGSAQLLQRKAGFDAVFCSSDTLALGVLQEARKRNIDVPKQLAIVGFGGLDFTEQTVPALSSVAIDRQGIGQRAARLILDRIDGRANPGAVVDVGFRIAERETS
jgi:LacI family gluconate utilization system Gnt-I transcriptional repressor